MVIDINQGSLPALLPFLRSALDLSYTATGVIVLAANITSSLIQPLFGHLADRTTRRWLLPVSVFLSAIGEARDRKVKAIEAFGYRYPEGTGPSERFLVHRTVFPSDFLADFGFVTVRAEGRVELARLELGGLVPVEEDSLAKAWRRLKEVVAPAPVPERF